MVRLVPAIVFLLAAPLCAFSQTLQSTLSSRQDLSTLRSILTQFPSLLSDLTSAGGTFLAPSNDAIANFVQASGSANISAIPAATVQRLLSYHILPLSLKSTDLSIQGGALARTSLVDQEFANLQGTPNVVFASAYGSTGQEVGPSGLKIYSGIGQSSNVTVPDIPFENGFVHVIDSVLNFPLPCTKTAEAASLSTLLKALQTTNLTDVVDTTPKFTCFAPTDQAFQKAGIDITKLATAQLTDALKYHSIVGDVGYSTAFEDGKEYQTLLGKPVTVHKRNGQMFINDVAVQVGNVIMSNGVAHVLSGVLSPPANPQVTITGTGTAAASASSGTKPYSAARSERSISGALGVLGATLLSIVSGVFLTML